MTNVSISAYRESWKKRGSKGFSGSSINFLFETHAIMLATQFNFVAISFRGVARIFQRGGHRGYSLLLSLLYQHAQSYYRGMKAHIN